MRYAPLICASFTLQRERDMHSRHDTAFYASQRLSAKSGPCIINNRKLVENHFTWRWCREIHSESVLVCNAIWKAVGSFVVSQDGSGEI